MTLDTANPPERRRLSWYQAYLLRPFRVTRPDIWVNFRPSVVGGCLDPRDLHLQARHA